MSKHGWGSLRGLDRMEAFVARLKPCPFTSHAESRLKLIHGLEAMLPVSGLSFVMSHGYDAQHAGVIQIDDGEGKSV